MIDARQLIKAGERQEKSLIEIKRDKAYLEIIRALNRRHEFGPRMIDCGDLGICRLLFDGYWRTEWYIPEPLESLKSLIRENKKKDLGG